MGKICILSKSLPLLLLSLSLSLSLSLLSILLLPPKTSAFAPFINDYYCSIKPTATSKTMSLAATAANTAARNVGKLTPSTSILLICDVQTRFRPLIHNMESLLHTTKFMTSVAKELDIPMVATQQYTKVFGPTIPEAFADPADIGTLCPVFEKKKFSMLTDECASHLHSLSGGGGGAPPRTNYLLLGIEAHVCLQQTALDLLELGHSVHVLADGVSSQQSYDRKMALKRMEQSGAWITTSQSAVFMLMGSAEHERFKSVSALVKGRMGEVNEFNDE
ncbi:hypothetical protein ACHAXS_013905 [Conticribra weissflogii]